MPIYEYVCEKDGEHMDQYAPRFESPPPICTKCKKPMKRIISNIGFVDGGFTPKHYRK